MSSSHLSFIDPALDLRDLHVVPESTWRTFPSLVSIPDFQVLQIWELPTKKDRYFIGSDVSDGIGSDRSVVDVVRDASLERPFEQVAQYLSSSIDPVDLAYVIDTIGRFYSDPEGFEAEVGVETNNQGIATQSELQRHLGYSNFYVWQWEDAAPGTQMFTRKIGWYTSRRTRPILLTRYVRAVTTVDEVTGQPDLIVNSPYTIDEMRDFQTEGQAWEAEAGPGATDDCIMGGAIAYFIAQQKHLESGMTIAEQRRQRAWQKARREYLLKNKRTARDYINTDCTAEEISGNDSSGGWP